MASIGKGRLEMMLGFVTDKEFLSPTLKNVLASLTPAREKLATIIASSESAVKKRISFDNQQSSTSGSIIPFTQILESSTQQTHQTNRLIEKYMNEGCKFGFNVGVTVDASIIEFRGHKRINLKAN
ncbi:outer membrane protein [Striga asiatica]|uniref:Outer membrane protein n=1 Tax=Striga asiatica TaxID=4170 RepID=A0A5A7QN96_STRAF|nr:outer membrane protein [Striga asiatica]